MSFDLVSKITVPALVLTGGADMYAPPAVTQLWAKRIPGAEFVAIPDVGHSAYWEAPEEFNRIVLRFLKRHKAPRKP